MSDGDPLRRYVEAGIALTQLTRARAEAIVKELVKAGELHREQAQDRVDELLDRSRKSTESLADLIRKELAQQLSSMGFATKADVEALEARLEARIASATGSPPARKAAAPAAETSPSAKKAPAKASAKKVPVKAPAKKWPTGTAGSTPAPGAATKRATPPPGTAARTAGAAKAARRRPAPGTGTDQG